MGAILLWNNGSPQSQAIGRTPIENPALSCPWHGTRRDFGSKSLLEAEGKKHMNTIENNL